MNEHLAEAEEKNVGKCQCNTNTDIPTDTSPSLLGRECYSHDCQDEGREWQSKAGILLDKSKLHICIASHSLDIDHVVQLLIIERFHCLLVQVEILG